MCVRARARVCVCVCVCVCLRAVVTGHVDGTIRVWGVEFWDEGHRETLKQAMDAPDSSDPDSVEAFLRAAFRCEP